MDVSTEVEVPRLLERGGKREAGDCFDGVHSG